MGKAIEAFAHALPDVFNHNVETVPRLYREVRPGGKSIQSLRLLREFKKSYPDVVTKAGFMLGLGEKREEILTVMQDLRKNAVDMLTLGQYLQPSRHHLAVERYVPPEEFEEYKHLAYEMGFKQVASGPLVRSSYHADDQAGTIITEKSMAEQDDDIYYPAT